DGSVGGGVLRRVLGGDRWLTPLGPETTTWVGCRLQRREPGLPDAVSSLSRCARLAGPAVSSGSALDDGPVGGPFECGQQIRHTASLRKPLMDVSATFPPDPQPPILVQPSHGALHHTSQETQ